ncbi:Hint domain-containing protein [Aliiroseovarius sp.]|uniref:Hint domain-containing protein n=1 Tax=Aliiroseovarius sp. TaxID=1872442 RepID=UPI003BAC56E9
MAQYEIWGYSSNALAYDPMTGGFTLDGSYDYTADRIQLVITDDDPYLDGDSAWPGTGDDTNQSGAIYSPDGTLIASGDVYVAAYADIQLPDGSIVTLQRIEVGGVHVGYLSSGPLPTGVDMPVVWSDDVDYYNAPNIGTHYSVPCFGPGTHLMTTEGEVPVDWLARGDRLITRDSGAQPVLWVGRFRVPAAEAQADDSLQPFLIEAGALGPDCPTHPMQLSAQHRVLLTGHAVELHTGTDEALSAVAHLEDGGLFRKFWPTRDFVFTHVLLERHEVIMANGLWVESLFLGENVELDLQRQVPHSVLTRPEVRQGHRQAARLCLKKHEVMAVLGRHAPAALPELLRAAG